MTPESNHTPHGGEMTPQEDALVQENAAKTEKFRTLGPERYFREVENPERFFKGPTIRRLCCIDEGVCEGLHVAGSGITMESPEEIDQLIREHGIEEIESHEGCGAAKLMANGNDAEAYSKEWAKAVAERNNIRYAGHRPLKEMHRPANLHHAEICYYDGTGQFNRVHGSELPAGFTITRTLSPSLVKDAELAELIAFGDHGSHKMMFVVLGGPDFSYEQLKEELSLHLGKHTNKVEITGFNVPVEWLQAQNEAAMV
jgi:hypothetical protein